MAISFSKLLDGSWGLRSDEELTPDQIVSVEKRDGSTTQARVGARIRTKGKYWYYKSMPVDMAGRCPICGSKDVETEKGKPFFCNECDML
jgi:membrane protein implicated in regulation of membrane protease activity